MGNDALMRVSPVGYLFDDLETIYSETEKATIISHDSALAIISAEALNNLIYLGRKGYKKMRLKLNFIHFINHLIK